MRIYIYRFKSDLETFNLFNVYFNLLSYSTQMTQLILHRAQRFILFAHIFFAAAAIDFVTKLAYILVNEGCT